MSERTPTGLRPGALVAVIGGGAAIHFAARLEELQEQHPDEVLMVSNSTVGFEVRAAGDPCGCRTCVAEDQQVRTDSGLYSWWGAMNVGMILCPECGHKRCPKATDHTLDCSGSNEPGQPGSAYE